MPYFHATKAGGSRGLRALRPDGYYESIGRDSIPERRGDFGFKVSKVKEICFAKTIEAAIIAVGRAFRNIDIYVTYERPDADLSDAGFDFGDLEEVRYRRMVPVKFYGNVLISAALQKQIAKCYPEEGYSIASGVLACLKKHIRRNVRIRPIPPMESRRYEWCWARKELGMSVAEMKRLFRKTKNQYHSS